jgi:hypothetical protein
VEPRIVEVRRLVEASRRGVVEIGRARRERAQHRTLELTDVADLPVTIARPGSVGVVVDCVVVFRST